MTKKKNDWECVEVKTGKSRQTRAQKNFEKAAKQKGEKYTLQREEPSFY